jgi:hypothetical protein
MADDKSLNNNENSDSDEVSADDVGNDSKHGRRIQDGITSKDPTGKMDLDRRYKDSDRRCMYPSVYKGRAQRFTVDRRQATRDRRKKD